MADKQKQYNLNLDPSKVRGANISRYSDGYSYASMSFKMSDKEFMSVNYEWQGSDIPEFAMSVMEIMQSLGKKEQASVVTVDDVSTIERIAKVLADTAAKMKKEMDPEADPDMEDEEDNMGGPNKKKGKKKKC